MHSYGKIYNLGHKAVESLLDGDVVCEEKVDGSQFSWRLTEEGHLEMRSKGADIVPEAPPKMFASAVETITRLREDDLLEVDWTYRGEVLAKPKHNVLAYDRVPTGNVILFEVDRGEEDCIPPEEKAAIARKLGLEVVPVLFRGKVESKEQLLAMLETVSILGGQTIEGVVIKAYGHFGVDGKTLMGKHVSEKFKEVHKKDWRLANPTGGDVLEDLVAAYRTQSRWEKAVQHLRERGDLTDSPRDIGPLLKEVNLDVIAECKEEISEELFKWAWKKRLSRGVTAGLPEWYKELLVGRQFDA
jgi:hypothetical protein